MSAAAANLAIALFIAVVARLACSRMALWMLWVVALGLVTAALEMPAERARDRQSTLAMAEGSYSETWSVRGTATYRLDIQSFRVLGSVWSSQSRGRGGQ